MKAHSSAVYGSYHAKYVSWPLCWLLELFQLANTGLWKQMNRELGCSIADFLDGTREAQQLLHFFLVISSCVTKIGQQGHLAMGMAQAGVAKWQAKGTHHVGSSGRSHTLFNVLIFGRQLSRPILPCHSRSMQLCNFRPSVGSFRSRGQMCPSRPLCRKIIGRHPTEGHPVFNEMC